jgi:DNA polymerase-1
LNRPVFTDHKVIVMADEFCHRNAWDCVVTAHLFARLLIELRDNEQLDFYEARVWPVVEAVLNMQRRGLLLNTQAKTNYRRKVRRELKETDDAIQSFAEGHGFDGGAGFNIDSPKQRASLLFDHLGLRPPKTTESGHRSTDQDALVRLLRSLRKRDEGCRTLLEHMFHRSRLHTIDIRYLELDPGMDGRVRPSIKAVGTETGRLAYADPPLQQFPPEARHIFEAPEGYRYLAGDYSQLEARIMAILSADQSSLRAFGSGEDVHAQNARDLFGWSVDAWEQLDDGRRKASRDFAKSFLYGMSYGGAADTMRNKLFCPCPKCVDKVPSSLEMGPKAKAEAMERWLTKHPVVGRWRNNLVKQVFANRTYINSLGRKRYFFQPPGDGLRREVYNFPIQSTAADIVNNAMIQLDTLGAPIVLQMHDSFMLEVPEGELDKWASTLKEVMEQPIPQLQNHSFPVELTSGQSWGSLTIYSS